MKSRWQLKIKERQERDVALTTAGHGRGKKEEGARGRREGEGKETEIGGRKKSKMKRKMQKRGEMGEREGQIVYVSLALRSYYSSVWWKK